MIPILSRGNILKWKFENVKDLNENGMYSDTFCIENINWKLFICKRLENKIEYFCIRLFYDCENKHEKNWICEVKQKFKLLNHINAEQDTCYQMHLCYDAKKFDWGYPHFLTWSGVEAGGHVKNDSLVVEVDLSFKYYDFSKSIPDYTDITIDVEGTKFFVNKGVLCSKSKFFYNLFVNEKSGTTIFNFIDLDVEIFRYFIASFYPLFESINKKNYKPLIQLAAKYGVPTLHTICEKFLIDDIEIDEDDIEIAERLKYADQHNYHDLMESCLSSLSVEEIKSLHRSVEFHNFKESTKLCIMTRLLKLL